MKLIKLYIRVLRALHRQAGLAWTLALANVALATASFAEPVLFGRVIDTLGGSASGPENLWPRLTLYLGLWAAFGIFTIVCSTLVALFADRLAHRQRQYMMAEFFEHSLELPLAYHSNMHSARLLKIMLQGTDSMWGLWIGFLRDHLAGFVSFFVLLPLSMLMNWRLGLLLILLCVVFSGLTAFVLRKTETLQSQVEEYYSELAERASDALGNVALVHSFAAVEAEVTGLKHLIGKLLAAQIPVLSWWAVISVLTRSATTITMLAIIIVGAYLKLKGSTTVGEIVTFMGFAGMLIQRLQDSVYFANRVFTDAPRLQQFFSVLDTEPAFERPDAVDPGRVKGAVEFRNVSFGYDEAYPAVSELNFKVEPGHRIALVGHTGAGKSTAMALLYRAFDPQRGVICVDGIDIRGLKLGALRQNIGVVFQEGLLFNRSVADNLRIGKPGATDAEIREAASQAQALEFIEQTAGRFDAKVGERGRLFSGGERQRLSIARVLLKNPPILILDEATSALDAETERRLLLALDTVMKGRTTFVIAHRLATIRKADCILVFEKGRVVETGDFDSLIGRDGSFAALARAQYLVSPAGEEIGHPPIPSRWCSN
jgi:ATP-binding cassette subfamily B protein